MYKKKPFTLIEILIVITIISILAALLLPVIFEVRQRANMANEKSNLKQLYQALIYYSEEYNNSFPYIESLNDTDGVSKTLWLLLPYINYSTKLISLSQNEMDGRAIYEAILTDPESTPQPGLSYVPTYIDADSVEQVLRFNNTDLSNIPIISTPKNKYNTNLVYLTFNGEVK